MPNYNYVIDSSFKPFTMQEMLVPFTAYKEAFEQSEAAYVDLTNKADKFSYLANNLNPDSKAAQIYNGYANELRAQAQDLARNGLSMSNRRALTELKRRYQGEIGRLVDADTARKAQIKEQSALLQQDPTRILSRRADRTDLDEYLDNPDLGYESYSGALLAKQANDAAVAVSKGLVRFRDTNQLDEYTKAWIEDSGMNPETVKAAVQNPNDPRNSEILNTIINNVVKSSGIPTWGNEDATKRAYDWASQGLWGAVGQSKLHTMEDFESRLKAEEESKLRLMNAEYARKAKLAEIAASSKGKKSSSSESSGIRPNPVFILGPNGSKAADNIEKYSQYFYKDSQGRTRLNNAGLKEYYRQSTPQATTATTSTGNVVTYNAGRGPEPSDFRKFVDEELGGAELVEKKQLGNLGNSWNQYKQRTGNGKYDTSRSTEYEYSPNSTQAKEFKGTVARATRGKDLEEVAFDSKERKFKPTGKKLSMKDLNSDKYTIVSTQFSPYEGGSTLMVQDDKGNIRRYKMPGGINHAAESSRDRVLQGAYEMQKWLTSGYAVDKNGKKTKLTPEEMYYVQQMYDEYIDRAYSEHSQLFLRNKTKEQEFESIDE